MKTVSLFSGIGGFELGFSEAGHRIVATCEVWEPAMAVLERRFPDVPNISDIRTFEKLPSGTELVVGGFPCQDLSQAGRTIGIGGERSGLVSEVFRLLDRSTPPWVLLENVPFMLSLDGGSAMKRLVSAFEDRGYRWAYRVVNTMAWLPQRRERVFFLASLIGDPADVLLADDAGATLPGTDLDRHAHGFYWTEGIRGLGWAPDAIPTLKNGSTVGIPSPPAILKKSGVVIKPDIRDAERLQGFPENWTETQVGSSRRSWRWSLVGNAVSVPVARWLGERLLRPGCYDRDRDRRPAEVFRWPRAARGDAGSFHAVEIGAFPVWKKRPSLEAFLNYAGEDLSVRACAGFLERASRSSLRFPPDFLVRIRRHMEATSGRPPNIAIACE